MRNRARLIASENVEVSGKNRLFIASEKPNTSRLATYLRGIGLCDLGIIIRNALWVLYQFDLALDNLLQ